jgi:hypothetical protein
MTGLIVATSPLPESAALHNCVVQAIRGSARRNGHPGGVPRCTASSCNCPVRSGRSSSRLRPATQNGAGRVRFART